MKDYVVQEPRLNYSEDTGVNIIPEDETYPKPHLWLRANASRFYFADEQIINESKKEFKSSAFWHAGIYFLVRDNKIVYVGSSKWVEFRIQQHKENQVEFDSSAWFEAPRIFLREIESYYINRINPPLNKHRISGHAFARIIKAMQPALCIETVPAHSPESA